MAGVGFLIPTGAAFAQELIVEPQDKVTGEIDRVGETHVVLVDLPAGAKVKLKVARKGKSDFLPSVVIVAPDDSDATAAFALRERRGGAQIGGGVKVLSMSGTWRIEISGASESLGTWSLKLVAKQQTKFNGDAIAPADDDGLFRFDVFKGSELKFSLRDVARNADPALTAVFHARSGALPLGGARVKLRRGKLSVSKVRTAATGAHTASVRLVGDAGGTLSVSLKAKAPKPRKMTLVHPGEGGDVPLAITTSALSSGTVGSSYTASVAAIGGTPGYTFDVISGDLPDGLDMESDGDIVGTPTANGTFGFTAQVTDSAATPTSATRNLSIRIDAASTGGSPEWRKLTPSGSAPAGRSSPGAVHDPVNDRMVISLGSTGSSGFPPVFGDTAGLSLGGSAAWTTLGTGPSARWGHSFVFDSTRNRALLFGGNVNGFQTNGEVWALDMSTSTGTWSQLSPSGTAPSARVAHTAIFDSDNDRMIVFGGGSGVAPGINSNNELWELSFTGSAQGAWTQRSPTGAPAAREFTAAIFDAANRRMVLFGGMTVGQQFGDLFGLDLRTPGQEAWSTITAGGTAPSARDEHSAVYDSRNGSMVMFGGLVGNSDTNDVYELDLTAGSESWTKLAPSGTLPTARDSHVAIYDPDNRRMLMFSGFAGFPSTPFDDIWELLLP